MVVLEAQLTSIDRISFMQSWEETRTILIVDDSEMIQDMLGQAFLLKGVGLGGVPAPGSSDAPGAHNYSEYWENVHFEVVATDNGSMALQYVAEKPDKFSAILLDIEMPIMDGLEILGRLSEMGVPTKIPVFLITASDDDRSVTYAYDHGVMDVLSKPVNPAIVWRRVTSVIELYEKRNKFEIEVKKKTRELERRNRQLDEMNMGMIEALATATEFRSEESGEHVRRIRKITELFLEDEDIGSEYSSEDKNQIARASMLHDVGKIGVEDKILNKPGRLDEDEFEKMKQHTVLGYKMLANIRQLKNLPFYEYARTIALYHHERWDGRGYPEHLAGDDIPMCAQIVSVADVYDALVSKRVYKPPLSHDEATRMIKDGKCGLFNPRLLACLDRIENRIRDHYNNIGH